MKFGSWFENTLRASKQWFAKGLQEHRARRRQKKSLKGGMVEDRSVLSYIADAVIILILCLVIFVCLVPMWHVLMSSLHSDPRNLMTETGVVWWFGDKINFEGYKILFTQTGGTFAQGNIFRGFFNTVLYMVANVAFGLVFNVIAGFCLSRKSKLRPYMVMYCMLSLIFSAGTVPTYIVLRNLGMTGNIMSLILPTCTNGMFMVLAMNAFMAVPEETVEAAEIDGAGSIRLMFVIMLPQAMGLILVTVINTAILQWNSWFQASIYVANQKELWPMQLWIRELVNSRNNFLTENPIVWDKYLLQFCVIIVSTLPILIAFPFFYKILEKNTIAGAVKG